MILLARSVPGCEGSCTDCQKTAQKGVSKAPTIPLPIIDVPFKCNAMDIVGPLPRNSLGKRFILVICDYATRYPEAVALRSIDANTIAEELVKVFCQARSPRRTDQGANFTL